MPKSKNRKQHKQKVEKFHNRLQKSRNNIDKMNHQMQSQMMGYYQQHYKDYMVEVAYKETPELLIEQENGYLLNSEKVEFQNGILVWKETGVAVMSAISLQTSNQGESTAVKPEDYTEEVMYAVLKRMFDRHQQQKVDATQVKAIANEDPYVTSGYSAPDWSTFTPNDEVPEAQLVEVVEPETK